jgi:hypothetical protein
MTSSIPTFDRLSSTAKVILFNSKWSNSTGYFDYAVEEDIAPVLEHGEVRTCVDLKNRRLVIIGTSQVEGVSENIVLFDRYSDRNGVIVQNWTTGAKANLLKNTDIEMSSSICEEKLAKFCKVLASTIDINGNTENRARKMLLDPWSVV